MSEKIPDMGLIDAVRWLLDDMHDAGETFGETGEMFDSVREVVNAVRPYVPAAEHPDWWAL